MIEELLAPSKEQVRSCFRIKTYFIALMAMISKIMPFPMPDIFGEAVSGLVNLFADTPLQNFESRG